MTTHTVLGANGSAGLALTRALAARGHNVIGVTRSGPLLPVDGVTYRTADLNDQEATRSAIEGADVVYLAAQPGYARWTTAFTPLLDSVLGALSRTDARLVFVDNLYMYAPTDGPISEATPLAPVTRKGAIRKDIHDRLMATHASGDLSVTIVRASDFFGPDAPNSLLTNLAVENGTKGKTMYWPLTLDAVHSVNYLPDTMRAAAMVGEDPTTAGRAWHLPAHEARTGEGWLSLVNDHLPSPVRTKVMPMFMPRMMGLINKDVREVPEIWTQQFARDWEIDSSAFESHFGPFTRTPIEEAMAVTVGAALATA